MIRPAIKGEKFRGVATTEPGEGSDIAAIKMAAKRKGKTWVLDGEKTFISGTEEAEKMGGGYFISRDRRPHRPELPTEA